jgi:hypothetical protein
VCRVKIAQVNVHDVVQGAYIFMQVFYAKSTTYIPRETAFVCIGALMNPPIALAYESPYCPCL